MTNVLIRKLEAFAPLPEQDRAFLDGITVGARDVGAREDLVREDDPPGQMRLIVEGFACRYKSLRNGKRQIIAYLIPGDLCDLHVFVLKRMDHSLGTLSRCKVVDLPQAKVFEMTERPAICRALWWGTLVDEAILREWLVNIGARPADQRIAHLMCELFLRLKTVGLANGGSYELPITQNELAETTGMSSVHVNRVLQRLRSENLITFEAGNLVIVDYERLVSFSGFNPNYLHVAALSRVREDRR